MFLVLTFGISVYGSEGTFIFGGKITGKQECTCSNGYQVTVQGFMTSKKSSGTYLYEENGTKVVGSKSKVDPGKLILGVYSPGGSCMITGDPCTELPITKGTMKKVKTN